MSKILRSNKERGLNLESNDDLCMGKCHVLSDVLLQFGELKESVNRISQTVDQLSQAVNQQNRRKGRTIKRCDEKVCILPDNNSTMTEEKSALYSSTSNSLLTVPRR